MRFKIIINTLFLILLTMLNLSVCSAETTPILREKWHNEKLLKKYPEILKKTNFHWLFENNTDKKTIGYSIHLASKDKIRPIIASISIDTIIYPRNNYAIDEITIDYSGSGLDKNIDFSDGCLSWSIDNLMNLENFHLYAMDYPKSAKKISPKNDGQWQLFSNISSSAPYEIGNIFKFLVLIENQNSYKRRQLRVFDREYVVFSTNIRLSSDEFEFASFNPNLPDFKIINSKLPDSMQKDNIPSQLKFEFSKYVINYEALLVSAKYVGNDKLFGKTPEIETIFDYSYDYDLNINKKTAVELKKSTETTLKKIQYSTARTIKNIEEESNRSTYLALLLFGISVFIAIITSFSKIKNSCWFF
ncbi:MAG: hypothetical protein KAS12_05035 [Candidatus Aenigmarchaeota archaeon]|nr:hypothetical protein [Candidatus Aenigmarchaeota archaeon]